MNLLLTNTFSGESVLFDNSDYICETVDWGTASGKHETSKFVSQIGTVIVGSTIESRDISITGWVNVENEDADRMALLKRKISKVINPLNTISIIVGEYEIDFTPNSSVKFASDWKENNDRLAKFVITGFCEYPLFSDKSPVSVDIAQFVPMFQLPLSFIPADPLIISTKSTSVFGTAYNGGDVNCGIVVKFMGFGNVVNPYLMNIATGEYVRMNKTMSLGEVITVDTNERSMRVTVTKDDVTTDAYEYFDLTSVFFKLFTGSNTLKFGADENEEAMMINVSFKNKYLEAF